MKKSHIAGYIGVAIIIGAMIIGGVEHTQSIREPNEVEVPQELIEEFKKERDRAANEVIRAEEELQDVTRLRDNLIKEQEMLQSQLHVRKIFEQRVDDEEVGTYQCRSSHMIKDFTGKSHVYADGIVHLTLNPNTISIDMGNRTVSSGAFETITTGSSIFAESVVKDDKFYRTYGDRLYPDAWYYEYQNKTERIIIVECIKI